MIDRHIAIALVIVALLGVPAIAQSNWEGTAVVGESADFPPGGMYAASGSFPLNSMVDITSDVSGRSGRVIIVRTLDDPGVFMLLSTTAAEALAIEPGDTTTVRARPVSLPGLTAVDPNQDLPFHPDPDINPSASLGDPNRTVIDPEGVEVPETPEPVTVAPISEPEAAVEVEPVAEAAPQTEPELVIEPEPAAEPEPTTEPEPAAEPIIDPQPEAVSEAIVEAPDATPEVLPYRPVPASPRVVVALNAPATPEEERPVIAVEEVVPEPVEPVVAESAEAEESLPIVAPPAAAMPAIALPLVVDRSEPEVTELAARLEPAPLPVTVLPLVPVEEEVEPGDLLRIEQEPEVILSLVLAEPVDETEPEIGPTPPVPPVEPVVAASIPEVIEEIPEEPAVEVAAVAETEPEPEPEVESEPVPEPEPEPVSEPTVVEEQFKPTLVPSESVITFERADFRPPDVPEPAAEDVEEPVIEEEPEPTPVVEPELEGEEPPAAIASVPESAVDPEELPLIRALEGGAYYLQVAAFTSLRSVKATLDSLGTRYPVAVLPDEATERRIYRVFVGPLSADEHGSALYSVRNQGFRDAFVRSATP